MELPPDYRVRRGRPSDAEAIADILNFYILTTTSTFMTEAVSIENRLAWIEQRRSDHPLWVLEHAGACVGWAALPEHRPRSGYRHTVENSIYLHPQHCGRGLGGRLLAQVIASAREGGFHVLVAGACAEQTASIRLHERAGYERVAHFREVAQKFSRWLDVVYLQLML